MTKFYSPSAHGFFTVPDDAVKITDEEWQSLLDQQSKGKIIQPGPDGKPVATGEIRRDIAAGRTFARDQLLKETDGLVQRHRDEIEAKRATTLTQEQYQALQQWRADLRDYTKDPDFPNVAFPARPAGI